MLFYMKKDDGGNFWWPIQSTSTQGAKQIASRWAGKNDVYVGTIPNGTTGVLLIAEKKNGKWSIVK